MDWASLTSQVEVSRETYERLELYVMLLKKWQRKINLISPMSVGDIWSRHILDGLQLAKRIPASASTLVDIGSGGGLPGIVLACVSDRESLLIESDQRKAAFLETVCAELELFHVKPICDRIEDVRIEKTVDVITARACAPLSHLLTLCHHLLSPETICLFPKGQKYAMEVGEANESWRFDWENYPSITDAQARILKLWNISKPLEF